MKLKNHLLADTSPRVAVSATARTSCRDSAVLIVCVYLVTLSHMARLVARIIVLVALVVVLIISFTMLHQSPKHALLTVAGFSRPMWEAPPKPFTVIPHFYHHNLTVHTHCKLHGFHVRPADKRVKIVDAILFSNELDVLMIRVREMMDSVDYFVIIESLRTFTGKEKPLTYRLNKHLFAFAEHKIRHVVMELPPLNGRDPFILERMQRQRMDSELEKLHLRAGIDLVIMADVDEIPSAATMSLLQNCIVPSMHLSLKTYRYSFEHLVDTTSSWRPKVVLYKQVGYGHSREFDNLLDSAGWHCSFCFRYISDLQFKMQAYSHADRIHSAKTLSAQHIQDCVCSGADVFGLIGESFTYRDMVRKLTRERQVSGMDLPYWVLANKEKYSFLLPGGCKRLLAPTDAVKLDNRLTFG